MRRPVAVPVPARRARAAVVPAVLALVLAFVLALSGCDQIGGRNDDPGPTTAPPTSAAVGEVAVDSQFTSDGTFQSHIGIDAVPDIDFVYTLYPTKATPRTNEWYPRGKKYFTFTFQAYDLARGLRAPFATKRLVYLESITVTSATITANGGRTERPYRLAVDAARATFDPEPQTTRYGMLITSPKGAFELRNQAIGTVSDDTVGVELTFTAVVHVQRSPGSTDYLRQKVTQVVPIAIFASDEATKATKIPVNAS